MKKGFHNLSFLLEVRKTEIRILREKLLSLEELKNKMLKQLLALKKLAQDLKNVIRNINMQSNFYRSTNEKIQVTCNYKSAQKKKRQHGLVVLDRKYNVTRLKFQNQIKKVFSGVINLKKKKLLKNKKNIKLKRICTKNIENFLQYRFIQTNNKIKAIYDQFEILQFKTKLQKVEYLKEENCLLINKRSVRKSFFYALFRRCILSKTELVKYKNKLHSLKVQIFYLVNRKTESRRSLFSNQLIRQRLKTKNNLFKKQDVCFFYKCLQNSVLSNFERYKLKEFNCFKIKSEKNEFYKKNLSKLLVNVISKCISFFSSQNKELFKKKIEKCLLFIDFYRMTKNLLLQVILFEKKNLINLKNVKYEKTQNKKFDHVVILNLSSYTIDLERKKMLQNLNDLKNETKNFMNERKKLREKYLFNIIWKQRTNLLEHLKMLLEKKTLFFMGKEKSLHRKLKLVILKTKKISINFEKTINYLIRISKRKMMNKKGINLRKKDFTSSLYGFSFKLPKHKTFDVVKLMGKVVTENSMQTNEKIKEVLKDLLNLTRLDKVSLEVILQNKKRALMMKLNDIILNFLRMKEKITNESVELFKSSRKRYLGSKKKILEKDRKKVEFVVLKTDLKKLTFKQEQITKKSQISFLNIQKKNRINRSFMHLTSKLIFYEFVNFLKNLFKKNIKNLKQCSVFLKKFKRSINEDERITRKKIKDLEIAQFKLNNSKLKTSLDVFEESYITTLRKHILYDSIGV